MNAPTRQSIDVQRILLYAATKLGYAVQYSLSDILYRRNFEKGQDVFERSALSKIACTPIVMADGKRHALFSDEHSALAWLDSDELRKEVLALAGAARRNGVKGTPFVVINSKFAICGVDEQEETYYKVSALS